MLSFFSYLEEQDGSGLTIFDIDDTLFKTNNRVHVVKDGKVIRKLNAAEFNMYTKKPGEQFDYKEFRDAKLFQQQAKPIRPVLAKLKAISKNVKNKPGSKVIFLTARTNFDDKKTFLDTFRKFGINIDDIYVERAGQINKKSNVAKKIIVNNYLKKGKFSRVRLYDDHKSNLTSFLELKEKYPDIQFEAFLVKNGNIRKLNA